MIDLRQLRQRVRTLRQTLSDSERQRASDSIYQRVIRLKTFTRAQHIAAFLAFEGEPDTSLLIKHASESGKTVYLPVLIEKRKPMLFAPYKPGDVLKVNWLNIPEPDIARSEMIAPERLNLVLTPLVAFDEQANRLGVGGGFYDRSFAFINENADFNRPCLLGIAFELQKVESLPKRDWDVALDGIATETHLYPGKHGNILE
jgi:5-formyltetrahydrofolate cyclo-ligase